MSHPPFAPAAKAAGAFCVVGEFEGARHGRAGSSKTRREQRRRIFNIHFYDRECAPQQVKPPQPQSDAAVERGLAQTRR